MKSLNKVQLIGWLGEAAGLDTSKIEKGQKEKADARSQRVKDRIKDLQKRRSKLTK